MVLKTNSFVNDKIKKLCLQVELLSGMKLVTDLNEEFQQIQFINRLGYIIIDYKHSACFTLSYKMSQKEWQTIEDIILYCQWLITGEKVKELLKNK